MYTVYYINSHGVKRYKAFTDRAEAVGFTAQLDKRIERGTCGGYNLNRTI